MLCYPFLSIRREPLPAAGLGFVLLPRFVVAVKKMCFYVFALFVFIKDGFAAVKKNHSAAAFII